MLSANDIHFLIQQDANIGSFIYRDWEPEELDEAINAEIFNLVNLALEKEIDKREEIEKLLLMSLTKTSCQTPSNGQVDKPVDYTSYISASSQVVQENCCKKRVFSVIEGRFYQTITPTFYNGIWYIKGESFIGKAPSIFYGAINEVTVKEQPGIFVDSSLFASFPSSFSSTYYTVIGNQIRLRSKSVITSFCLDYIASLDDSMKINSCNGKTLNFPENIQRWVIEKTALRLAIRNEESQQKIENMKSE